MVCIAGWPAFLWFMILIDPCTHVQGVIMIINVCGDMCLSVTTLAAVIICSLIKEGWHWLLHYPLVHMHKGYRNWFVFGPIHHASHDITDLLHVNKKNNQMRIAINTCKNRINLTIKIGAKE